MTIENLNKGVELKQKLDTYNNFKNLFTPSQSTLPAGPTAIAGVVFSINYTPETTDERGNVVEGCWKVVSVSQSSSQELLSLINTSISSELTSMKTSIFAALDQKILEVQTELEGL